MFENIREGKCVLPLSHSATDLKYLEAEMSVGLQETLRTKLCCQVQQVKTKTIVSCLVLLTALAVNLQLLL